MARIKFDLYWNTDSNSWEALDPETGEVKEFSVKKSTSKKTSTKKDEDPNPKLILDSNKYTLTQAAIDLLGVSADDRIDIKYEKQGKVLYPIIGSSETFGTKAGNKLTQKGTVSFRGKNHEELEEFGTEFTLIAHPTKSGLFILQGNKVQPQPIEIDVVEIEDEDEVDIKDELDDLLESDNTDDVKEITNFDFSI